MASEIKHESMDEAVLKTHEDLTSAILTGRWMVAIWSVENEGPDGFKMRRTSWMFPSSESEKAVKMISDSLNVASGPRRPMPLPPAVDFLKSIKARTMPLRPEPTPPPLPTSDADGPSSMGLAPDRATPPINIDVPKVEPDVVPVKPAEQDEAT